VSDIISSVATAQHVDHISHHTFTDGIHCALHSVSEILMTNSHQAQKSRQLT